jgi:hypothetical protein
MLHLDFMTVSAEAIIEVEFDYIPGEPMCERRRNDGIRARHIRLPVKRMKFPKI